MARAARTPYLFTTSCTHADAPSLDAMLEAARDISWRTFWRYVDRTEAHEMLGYDRRALPALTLERDGAVRVPGRSVFRGRPCVFLTHSATEYIYAAA